MRWQLRAGAVTAAVLSTVAAIGASSGSGGSDPPVVGGAATYVVRAGDSLRSVSSRQGIDVGMLAEENGVRVDAKLRAGQELRVDNRHIVPPGADIGVLVINVPQRMLFYAGDDGTRLAFPVAVGRRDWPTPLGPFTVIVTETQPTWDVPQSILEEARRAGRTLPERVPPGPENPLGEFWIGLSLGSVGVHGTNAPSSIYRAATHGCIRLHSDDVAELFPLVRVGTPGRVLYEPVLLTTDGDAVLLEVHRDVYGHVREGLFERARSRAAAAGLTNRIDWTIADAVIQARRGVARNVTKQEFAPD